MNLEPGHVVTEEEVKAAHAKAREEIAIRFFSEHGKHEINNLLWSLLPPWVTMSEAETIATTTHIMIGNEWSKGDPRQRKGQS